jgi:hypothetical protein
MHVVIQEGDVVLNTCTKRWHETWYHASENYHSNHMIILHFYEVLYKQRRFYRMGLIDTTVSMGQCVFGYLMISKKSVRTGSGILPFYAQILRNRRDGRILFIRLNLFIYNLLFCTH